MPTTLPLLAKLKVDTRKDGSISYAKVRVRVDGTAVVKDFRAKVGEEPVVIDGDTITVPDAQAGLAAAAAAERIAFADARAATIARFGALAPITAVSDAQAAFAEKERSSKLPVIAAELDERAARAGWDAATLQRAFRHVAAQDDARFWIETSPEWARGGTDGARQLQAAFYHFA